LVSRPLARHGSYSGFVAGALGKLEDFLQAAVRRPIEVISKRGSAATALPRRAASSDFLAGRRGSSAKAGVGAAGGGKHFFRSGMNRSGGWRDRGVLIRHLRRKT